MSTTEELNFDDFNEFNIKDDEDINKNFDFINNWSDWSDSDS